MKSSLILLLYLVFAISWVATGRGSISDPALDFMMLDYSQIQRAPEQFDLIFNYESKAIYMRPNEIFGKPTQLISIPQNKER